MKTGLPRLCRLEIDVASNQVLSDPSGGAPGSTWLVVRPDVFGDHAVLHEAEPARAVLTPSLKTRLLGELVQNPRRFDAYSPTDLHELEHFDAALAPFVLGHKALVSV